MSDFTGTAHSRMSTIRMGFVPIPVTVRSAGAMTHLVAQEPAGARDVTIAAIRPPCRAPQPADLQEVIMAASDRFEVPPEMRAFAEIKRRAGEAGRRRLHFRGAPGHERVRRSG